MKKDSSTPISPTPRPALKTDSSGSVAPVSPFPVDVSRAEEKRGPGRPAKICGKCGQMASVCKCVPEPVAFEEQTIKQILAGAFKTIGGSVAIITGLSQEKMAQIWTLAEGELMVMAPPVTKVVNKYLPDIAKALQDEMAAAMILLPILAVKVTLTRALLAQHKEKQKQTPPSPAIRENVSPPVSQAAAA